MYTKDFTMLSMWPLIGRYDQVGEIKPQKNYELDDIVVFKQGDILIAHRIIYISDLAGEVSYVTQGDNNAEVETRVKKSQVLGKVISLIRNKEIIKVEKFYLKQSHNYLSEYRKFAREAKNSHLSYVVLKGLPLYRKYTNSYPRHFIYDLDILIHQKDINKVLKIAKVLGYQIPGDFENQTEFNLTKIVDGLPLSLDIHLQPAVAFTQFPTFNRLIPEMKILETEIWKTSRNHHLSPNHQYLYLLLHLFHHSFEGTKRWNLISQLEGIKLISAKKCKKIIDQLSIGNYVYPALYMMRSYYPNNSKSLKLLSLMNPALKTVILSRLILSIKKPWTKSNRIINRLELLFYVTVLSRLSLAKKLAIIFHSIIALDFKRSKNWLISSRA